jgi:hypothetical protein
MATAETARASAPAAHEPGGTPELWARVDRLIDRAPRESDLRAHGIHLLAAQRFRSLGRPVSAQLEDDAWSAAVFSLAAPFVLERVRESCSGQIVLMKGPEVAFRYPGPALRGFRDVDLLVPDAEAVQRRLVAAGFEPVGLPEKYAAIHHLRPLAYPGLPLLVEVHDRPKWPEYLPTPAKEELLDAAVPSSIGIDGIDTLPPAHHALVLAAHAHAHGPVTKLVHALDIALMAGDADRDELTALARRWEMEHLWRTTSAIADALFADGRKPLALRLWARGLPAARERTVLESHVEEWLAPFWAYRARVAVKATASLLADEVRPLDDETWRDKFRRAVRVVRHPFARLSDHRRKEGSS